MEWTSYVKNELTKPNSLHNLTITFGDKNRSIGMPPIITVSVNLLNRFLSTGEKHIVMVFPEKIKSSFLLSVIKIISDISEGKIEKTYNPASFQKGQKLKCKNCVVEFECVEEKNGVTMLWVRDSDCTVGIPIELAPFFQLTETNRRLSKDAEFSIVKKQIRKEKVAMSEDQKLTSMLIDYKTHFNNTVFNVTPIGKAKDLLSTVCLNGTSVKDLLLVGQSDIEGNVEIINKGQLTGEPAIIMTPDLYAVNEAIKKDSDVKLLLIDVSNANLINNQLDALDELRRKDFPIVCLTDTANSFELGLLEQRGFYIWRWDEESISDDMFIDPQKQIDQKVENCAKQRIEYLNCESKEISDALARLYSNRQTISEATGNVPVVYDKLFSTVFIFLRSIVALSSDERRELRTNLESCKAQLEAVKRFISNELYKDLFEVISNLELVLRQEYIFPKITALKKKLLCDSYESICIVIHDKADKEKHQQYWDDYCRQENLNTVVHVMRQEEYFDSESINCDITIICGWINKDRMRRILYGYKTLGYLVLLYDYEQRWKKPHTNDWKRTLHKGNKRRVIEKALSTDQIDTTRFIEVADTDIVQQDELDEINMILRENKYRRYLAGGGNRNIDEVVEAIPVNYVGGCFAFYKSTHKIVSVADIVLKDKNEIKMLLPAELEIGDFIVVREAQRDLVKEMADNILASNEKIEMRDLAKKWKDSLEIESIFSSFEEIYRKLQAEGCKKNWFTVRQWMKNEDIIAPQDKNDLRFIAKATEDAVLLERIDDIYEAGKQVKRAHVQAGRNLSLLLKRQIADKLQELGKIDPYNIWEPITLYLDGIGNVKILKVIDIGKKMLVDATNVNRLIDEF